MEKFRALSLSKKQEQVRRIGKCVAVSADGSRTYYSMGDHFALVITDKAGRIGRIKSFRTGVLFAEMMAQITAGRCPPDPSHA